MLWGSIDGREVQLVTLKTECLEASAVLCELPIVKAKGGFEARVQSRAEIPSRWTFAVWALLSSLCDSRPVVGAGRPAGSRPELLR